MRGSGMVGLGGLAALLGGILCLLLTPIQASIWDTTGRAPLVRASGPLPDLTGRLHGALAPGLDAYYFYGRMFPLVYVGAIAGLVGLHALQSGATPWERTWFRVLLVGLLLALLGDIGAYWGGSGNISASLFQGAAFSFEMLAVLVVLVSSVFYGVVTLRANAVPRWVAWLLVIAGPAAVLGVLLTGYIPHGAILPLSLALAVAGCFLVAACRRQQRPV